MAGVPKQVVNAIRSVAFMLDEVEDSHINTTLREALDSQMTEFTSDFKLLVEDAKEKFDEHVKTVGKQRTDMAVPPPAQSRPLTNMCASALINPPAHTNPKVATREGIKARQFMIQGLDGSKLSHLDASQLKAEFNRTLLELGSAWKSSPVRFLGLFGQDRDQDRSIKTHTSRKTGPRPQKTAKSVFCGLFAVSRPV